MSKKTYKDYFNIDPKYYAAVTADLIKSGEVKWTSFYPHETFVKLLEKTHIMLSGKDSRSLWVEGAYGTGKSHAALTVKSMLEASDDEIRAYFKDYGLRDDLCQQLITDKSNGRLITIHRIGSASIRSDQDLILALQDSIAAALQEHGITNRGEASLKESALRWLEDKEANRVYFDSLIQEDKYMWDFGGKHVNEVISVLKNSEDEAAVSKMMRHILKVAEDNGITALRLDIPAMCDWIKSIIDENDISAILFVWDEFTEYFQNNQNALTGFQTLAEISESHPFYFLIVTHESSSLIQDKDMRKKILNRFVGDVTVRIEMPENMAFRLMAQAMKTTDDPVLLPEWTKYKGDLNEGLTSVRNTIIASAKKHSTMGQKTVISDTELQSIVPIHPYAALLLKHMSVAFNSNARSMFDFIISNDMSDAKGFKWFINEYGPEESINLLTIDMLWDFFTGKDQNGLNDDVRVILDSFGLLKKGSLTPDQERVFKTVLLLEAISLRVGNVELLRPNEQNIDLAFVGTDWSKGKARNIAAGLCQQGLLFEKPVGNGLKEYTVANRDGDIGKINKLKADIRNSTKTQDLIVSADLMSAVQLPVAIRPRFVMEGAASSNLTPISSKLSGQSKPNRFKTVVAFALNDTEAATIRNAILKAIVQPSNELFYIECLTPMGDDLLSQYVENMAYSKNYAQNDRQRAMGFETQAKKCLTEWKQRISAGAFTLYTPEHKSGTRVANLAALQEALQKLNHQIYFCGLEQFNLIDNMFLKGPLAQGAECGITEELKSTFKSSNVKTSLATALDGAWKVKRYWEDPTKKSLPIVRIKQEVEKVIKAGFEKASGRISILSIYEALEEAPYGFMPSNVTAFVMGFVLKEYATSDYFWSNGPFSESMTPGKMKQMIANAINQKFSPSSKYKEEQFYNALITQREAFEHFYKDQLPYFKQVAGTFVEELDEQDVAGFCNTLPAGQFTKSSTEYYQYIENAVSNYKKSIRRTQLKNLWLEKTGTKDPSDWSDRYDTPILCMFDDTERGEARTIFATILAYAASDADITKAINYLEAATFYDRLNDPLERDRCFMERVVGDYAVMLKDADSIRKSLIGSIPDKAYNWMDNSAVKNRLKVLAEKQYKLSGCERAQAVIDKMDATELRRYLNELIADNLTVGMEILKNE